MEKSLTKIKFSLRDSLFNEKKIILISQQILRFYPKFKINFFKKEVLEKFPELELKQRIKWIAICLKKYLPPSFEDALQILIYSLPPPNNPNLKDNDFGDFIYATYSEFIVQNGCNEKYFLLSLHALYEITQRFSAEDAIRYFINFNPTNTLDIIKKWCVNKNYHVRRLCSEGTRPKLPWSQKINIDISKPIKILDNLFYDQTRYVTRSVANHINDIAKIDANLAIATLKRWQNSGLQNEKEMNFIIHHGLRNLIKQGNKEVLRMLNIDNEVDFKICQFKISNEVKINQKLEFSFEIFSEKQAQFIANYKIYFVNKNGKLNNGKIFKLRNFNLKSGELIRLSKSHFMKEEMTTRKIFKGLHKLEIIINGKVTKVEDFIVS